MGTPKALLEFDGEAMLVRTLRRLSAICGGPRFVVAAADQVLPPLSNDDIVLRSTQTYSATRNDGDAGVGGVSVDVLRETPREINGFVILPFLNP